MITLAVRYQVFLKQSAKLRRTHMQAHRQTQNKKEIYGFSDLWTKTNPIDCTVPIFNSVDSEVGVSKFRFQRFLIFTHIIATVWLELSLSQLSKGDGGDTHKKMFFDCEADITAENRTQAQVELANSTQNGNEPGTLLLWDGCITELPKYHAVV